MSRRRAALVMQREPERWSLEWARLLEYCAEHNWTPTALTRDPSAAVALGMAGLVDVVVAPSVDVQRILVNAECRVELIRPVNLRDSREATMILGMLSRGGTPGVVAQLLDLPLNLVLDVKRTREVQAARQRTPAELARAGRRAAAAS